MEEVISAFYKGLCLHVCCVQITYGGESVSIVRALYIAYVKDGLIILELGHSVRSLVSGSMWQTSFCPLQMNLLGLQGLNVTLPENRLLSQPHNTTHY